MVGNEEGETEEREEVKEEAAGVECGSERGIREVWVEGAVEARPGAEETTSEGFGEVRGDALHSIAVGGGEEGDLLEKSVGLVDIPGGNMGGAVEKEVDEEKTSLIGFEITEPWSVGGAKRGR